MRVQYCDQQIIPNLGDSNLHFLGIGRKSWKTSDMKVYLFYIILFQHFLGQKLWKLQIANFQQISNLLFPFIQVFSV